jgi:hypothetical protein
VLLTEGELKADLASKLSGLPVVAAPGCSSWGPCLPLLQALGCKTVRLAFDADAFDKTPVARALAGCAVGLQEAGFAVEVAAWDKGAGKGIDDALQAGAAVSALVGAQALAFISDALTTATAGEDNASEDLEGKALGLLDEGGPAVLFADGPTLQALALLQVEDAAAFESLKSLLLENGVKSRALDNAIKPLVKQISAERRQAAEENGQAAEYFVDGGRIRRRIMTEDGEIVVALANFEARIVEDLAKDDGAEQTRVLVIEGQTDDGRPLPRVEVDAPAFGKMEWPVPSWGPSAVVAAGPGARDHLRAALQTLSGDVRRRVAYSHIGWREVDGKHFYLHAGGAIGADGPAPGVSVSVTGALTRYRLPDPPAVGNATLTEAVNASLRLLDLGPPSATVPLLVSPYRAVLGGADFSLALIGATGSFKSCWAALAQAHFGSEFTALSLPASWSSTANSLEMVAFLAKDALLTVDDFCPHGGAVDVQRYHGQADRLLRGQGNHAGRGRLKADGTLRPERAPRGLVLMTGEDVPRGQSLQARLLALELRQEFTDTAALSACQADAEAGLYALALAGFIRWLAPNYGELGAGLRAELAGLRTQFARAGWHARSPGIVADLALGLQYFLAFAEEAGAITSARRQALQKQGEDAFRQAVGDQAISIGDSDPGEIFLRLLAAALASGRAHVAGRDGREPRHPERWGWRGRELGSGGEEGPSVVYQAQGAQVGWVHGDDLYLIPDAAYAEVQRMATAQNAPIAFGMKAVWRRLRDTGKLASFDKERLTARVTLQGTNRTVLHLRVPNSAPTADVSEAPPAPAAEGNGHATDDPHANGWPTWTVGRLAHEEGY